MAKEYGQRPSSFLVKESQETSWLSYQIDRATFQWGRFIQGKIDETIQVPASKSKQPHTIQKPKYSPQQIMDFLTKPLGPDGKIEAPIAINLEDLTYGEEGWETVAPGSNHHETEATS